MVFCFLHFNITIWESRFTLLTAVPKISPSSQNIDSSSRASIAFTISLSVGGTFGSSITKSVSVSSFSSGTLPCISAMISASLVFSPCVDSSASTSKRSFSSSRASSGNHSQSSVMVFSRSAVISLKGSSSSLIACSADFSEIPLFRKQFFMVNSDTFEQADCNSCIASHIDVCGSFFFMSTARISRFMIFL